MQPGPADELHITAVQVKVLCQYSLNTLPIFGIVHRLVEFYYAAEFVATHVTFIGQYELRVVLDGHGDTVRRPGGDDCELSHRKPDFAEELPE